MVVRDSHKIDVTLFNDSLSEEQAELLRECARQRGRKPRVDDPPRYCHVAPLQRFGYSGAHLFEARFDKANDGVPHVVKIHDRASLTREFDRQRDAETYFPDAAGATFVDGAGTLCAIIYRKIGTTGDAIVELKDLYEKRCSVTNTRRMCMILKRLYNENRHVSVASVTWKDISLGVAFRPYRRKLLDRVSAVWPKGESPGSLFPDVRPYPPDLHTTLETMRETIATSPIHGDLHPNNVLMNKAGRPVIIDYAWYLSAGPVLADFVLMECSLRFLLFPTNLRWEMHHAVNIAMSHDDGPDQVRGLMRNGDQAHACQYDAMAELVEIIRASAEAAVGTGYSFRSYLRAQFLVLYGLSKIPGYNCYAALDALREIGRAIEER